MKMTMRLKLCSFLHSEFFHFLLKDYTNSIETLVAYYQPTYHIPEDCNV